MALEIIKEQDAAKVDKYVLDAYWCLTADKSRAVPEGHPEARFVLGGPGSTITLKEAIGYGIVVPEPPLADKSKDEALKAISEAAQQAADHGAKEKPHHKKHKAEAEAAGEKGE